MGHISDFDLERWHLGMIDQEEELGQIEVHVIGCQDCLLRALEAQRYVDTMRAAIITGNFDFGVDTAESFAGTAMISIMVGFPIKQKGD